jgi:transposase
MVLLEDEEYRDLRSRADKRDKSEQLEKEMLALQILAREKTVQAEQSKAEIERLKRETQRLEHDNRILMEHYALSRQRQFGISSEKTAVGQEQMFFNEAEACASLNAPEPEITVNAHTRKKTRSKREIDLSLLPVEEIRYELSDDEKACPRCSTEMHRIGEEVTSKLKFVPGHFVHEKHIREVLGCRPCDRNEISTPIITARMPKQAFPKSLASASLVAYIMMRKYVEGLPLYRQEQQFRRTGIALSRQNLANWVIAGAVWLEHIYKAMHAILRKQDIAHSDETELQVLREAGKAAQAKSYMWLYASGRYFHPIRLYDYRRTHAAHNPLEFLAGFAGYLHVDGNTIYKKLPGIVPAGCWAHARRKYTDIIKTLPPEAQKRCSTPAHIGRKYCNDLFDIERDLKDATPEERHAARQVRSRAVLDAYREWLDKMVIETTSQNKLGEAIRYSINQWEDLIRFLEDGRLEIDNNRAERAIKPFVMGRKAWMFANTPGGARASAITYSIAETAKENGLDPLVYLVYLFEQLPNIDIEDELAIAELLPWSDLIQSSCKAKLSPTRKA